MTNLFQIDQISLHYISKYKASERLKILCSEDAHHILKANWSAQLSLLEEFNILLLDNQNQVLGISNISKGGLCSTIVDVRIAFVTALNAKACAMILAHNHPSATLKPSTQDIRLTEKFVAAGKVLDIKIHDHIIVTPEDSYFSFADEGFDLGD